MLKLIYCEFLKLKRRPLFFASALLSALIPAAFELLIQNAGTSAEALNGMMSTLFQLSAYLILMPLVVILAANLLFMEQDSHTLKNLLTIPVSRSRLAIAKMLVLLLFALFFMAVGGMVNLIMLLLEGWETTGFWAFFRIGLGVGFMMWAGALPCVLLVAAFNKSYIVSVIITFFYTMVNYIFSSSDFFIAQPFGLNVGTLFPGPLSFRWFYQFYDHRNPGAELAALLERISPYFVSNAQAFGVFAAEAAVFLALIAVVYRRQEV